MHQKIFLFLFGFLFFSSVSAVELNWHDVKFESTNYARTAVNGGAAIYALPSKDTLKFKISFVLPNSIFTMQQSDIVATNAMADLLILGGFGKKSYEQIQKELAQNGIMLATTINDNGNLVISCEALTEDFDRVLTLLHNLILQPNFDPAALTLWKAQRKSEFIDLSNVNTLRKQMFLIHVQSMSLAFGESHYLAETLERASPQSTESVTIKQIQSIYKSILNRNGLNVLLAGSYPTHGMHNLANMIQQIPVAHLPITKWLPERLNPQSSHDVKQAKHPIKVVLIHKSDMTQSQMSLRLYYSNFGELNQIEKAQSTLLTEVFSSTGGVVGNDRFSKAMRADSGFSYSAHASFHPDIVVPNTNVSSFVMNFQSPNEKVSDAVLLAKKTWDLFVNKGISAHELTNTREALMNSMLAHEFTVFDKADMFFSKILRGKIPSVNPVQEHLESLDQQRNIDAMNAFLTSRFQASQFGTLVIMGNPDKNEIEKLKNISDLDFVEMKEVNSFFKKNFNVK